MREIKKAQTEDEKLEPSDVFSAMQPVEILRALVSHMMTERVDRRGRNLVLAVFDVSRAHVYGVNAMCTWNHLQNCIVLDSLANSKKRILVHKMRAMRGGKCDVNMSGALGFNLVQATRYCTDRNC